MKRTATRDFSELPREFFRLLDIFAFDSGGVRDLTGISPRSLQNAITRGLLPVQGSPGKGSRRQYTGRQLIAVALLGQLLALRVSVQESAGWITDIRLNYLSKVAEEVLAAADWTLPLRGRLLMLRPGSDGTEPHLTEEHIKDERLDVSRIGRAVVVIPVGRMLIHLATQWATMQCKQGRKP